MTGNLIGNNARTESARKLCEKINELFCQQDERIAGLERSIGLCPPHLKIAEKLFDFPQSYGCPQCQRNRTCELEEITSELLSSLRILVLFLQAETPVNPRLEPWRVAMNKAASAIEHADNFSASDQPGGCLNEPSNGVAADALEPCPFCGAPAQRFALPDGDCHVRCTSVACKVHPVTKAGVRTSEEADAIWNQRPGGME